METENRKCENCGGSLKFDPEKQLLVCQYCQSEFPIKKNVKDSKKEKENKEYCSHMNQYHCNSCGATMIVDDTTATDTCVYCHSPIAITGRLEGETKPDKIIPFAYDINQAKDIFLENVGKRKFTPHSYFNKKQINNIQGIYYPFWIVDIDLSASASFSATKVSSWSDSKYNYTKHSYYKLHRSGDIHLEDVASCAIKNVDRKMLERVFPYPSDKHLDFDKAYLVGYKSQKRDLNKSDITPNVHEKIQKYSIAELQSNILGYNSVILEKSDYNIHNETWSYVLLPIYVLTYKKSKKIYTYAMNGYSGKIYGEYPISFFKVSSLFIAILLIGVIIGLAVYLS